MRALKALVIVMSVLIFAGVVALIIGIVEKAGELDVETPTVADQFEATTIELPAGAKIQETRVAGSSIVIRLSLADGTSRLVLLSAADGEKIGEIDLKIAP